MEGRKLRTEKELKKKTHKNLESRKMNENRKDWQTLETKSIVRGCAPGDFKPPYLKSKRF